MSGASAFTAFAEEGVFDGLDMSPENREGAVCCHGCMFELVGRILDPGRCKLRSGASYGFPGDWRLEVPDTTRKKYNELSYTLLSIISHNQRKYGQNKSTNRKG